jgi:hypothetical protein
MAGGAFRLSQAPLNELFHGRLVGDRAFGLSADSYRIVSRGVV